LYPKKYYSKSNINWFKYLLVSTLRVTSSIPSIVVRNEIACTRSEWAILHSWWIKSIDQMASRISLGDSQEKKIWSITVIETRDYRCLLSIIDHLLSRKTIHRLKILANRSNCHYRSNYHSVQDKIDILFNAKDNLLHNYVQQRHQCMEKTVLLQRLKIKS